MTSSGHIPCTACHHG